MGQPRVIRPLTIGLGSVLGFGISGRGTGQSLSLTCPPSVLAGIWSPPTGIRPIGPGIAAQSAAFLSFPRKRESRFITNWMSHDELQENMAKAIRCQ